MFLKKKTRINNILNSIHGKLYDNGDTNTYINTGGKRMVTRV